MKTRRPFFSIRSTGTILGINMKLGFHHSVPKVPAEWILVLDSHQYLGVGLAALLVSDWLLQWTHPCSAKHLILVPIGSFRSLT